MAVLEALLTSLVVLVGLWVALGLALGAYGTLVMWRARRVARRAAQVLARSSRMADGADADGAAPALPALPPGDAGLGHAAAPTSSFADDVASRLVH